MRKSSTPPTLQDKAVLLAEYKAACDRCAKLYRPGLPDAEQSEDWRAACDRADVVWKQIKAMN